MSCSDRLVVGFLLVLVLLGSTSTTSPAEAAGDYCGSTEVNDPNFPGYVEYALSQAIYMLVTENARGVSFRYPPPPFGEGGASSAANCWLNDMNECDKCLNQLLQYVYNCSSYDSGSAYYYNECSLSFWLWTG